VRTTLTLDDDVYEAIRARTRITGESLGKAVSQLARQGMKPMDTLRMVKKGRFYQVDLPPDTPKIHPDRVQRFLDEESVF
jgi:hypothetical protein